MMWKRCMWLAWLSQFKRQCYEPLVCLLQYVSWQTSGQAWHECQRGVWLWELCLKSLRSKVTRVEVHENHMHEDLGMTWQTVHVPIHHGSLIEFWSLSVENNKERGYTFLLFLVFPKIWNVVGKQIAETTYECIAPELWRCTQKAEGRNIRRTQLREIKLCISPACSKLRRKGNP